MAQFWTGQAPVQVPNGLIHDWIGAIFMPDTTVKDTLALIQDYDNHKYVSDTSYSVKVDYVRFAQSIRTRPAICCQIEAAVRSPTPELSACVAPLLRV